MRHKLTNPITGLRNVALPLEPKGQHGPRVARLGRDILYGSLLNIY